MKKNDYNFALMVVLFIMILCMVLMLGELSIIAKALNSIATSMGGM